MTVLESAPGQAATNLADVFHRNLLPDGRVILEALHREGMLKKIATNQVIVTPTATASVKLDELNRLVREMESGTEALKRMQAIDKSSGMVPPEVKRQAEKAFKEGRSPTQPLVASQSDALDDKALASNMLEQAKRMETDAKGLIAEAARMKKDAERMHPGVVKKIASDKPASTAEKTTKTRGRKKAVAADAVQ
jgi:hypothetical protein